MEDQKKIFIRLLAGGGPRMEGGGQIEISSLRRDLRLHLSPVTGASLMTLIHDEGQGNDRMVLR